MEYTRHMPEIKDGSYKVRISDNVLDEEDWGSNTIHIEDGVVVMSVTNVDKGVYNIPNMYGWTVGQIKDWLSWDPTGHHPENYHEIKAY
jgi:hypothetical protein